MDKKELDLLSKVQINQVAVTYLLGHKEECPPGTEKLIDKLISYNGTISGIMKAMNEAKNTVQQLQPKADQILGSIETILELISDVIPEDRALDLASKYDMDALRQSMGQPTQALRVPDIAGSAGKKYNEEHPVPVGG